MLQTPTFQVCDGSVVRINTLKSKGHPDTTGYFRAEKLMGIQFMYTFCY